MPPPWERHAARPSISFLRCVPYLDVYWERNVLDPVFRISSKLVALHHDCRVLLSLLGVVWSLQQIAQAVLLVIT